MEFSLARPQATSEATLAAADLPGGTGEEYGVAASLGDEAEAVGLGDKVQITKAADGIIWSNTAKTAVRKPMKIVQPILERYRNAKQLALVPPDHPALATNTFRRSPNEPGIHLHVISSSGCAFQLIYEGPDQLPFTDDDQVRNFPPDLKFE